MIRNECIRNVIPAPDGLLAIYNPTKGKIRERYKTVIAFAPVDEREDAFDRIETYFKAMVIDMEHGMLVPADEIKGFNRLECQQK